MNTYHSTDINQFITDSTNVDPRWPKQANPQFFQGDDIKLPFYVVVDKVPVSEDTHIMSITLKKSNYAVNMLWTATIGNGLFKMPGVQGYYYILIPSAVSSLLLPGYYSFDIRLTDNTTMGSNVARSFVVASYGFNLELSSSSPNPSLTTNPLNTEQSYNTGKVVSSAIESTLPLGLAGVVNNPSIPTLITYREV